MFVYILTIVDEANFSEVECYEVFASWEQADDHSILKIIELVERDAHYHLGDTFSRLIEEKEVHGI